MTLFSRILIIVLCIQGSSEAYQWPWIVIQDTQETYSTPKKQLRSKTNLKKTMTYERVRHLFSDAVLPLVHTKDDSLEDLFAHARTKPLLKVRVLLAKTDITASMEWRFSSAQGFIVQWFDGSQNVKKRIKNSGITVKIRHGFLWCNGKRIQSTLRLQPVIDHGECNGIVYDGNFFIMQHKDAFLCINQLNLEDYICAVLRTESWPGWPLEVNKVFAIACRSYVMFKALEAKRTGRPYHVKNTNAHQTYRGKHNLPVLKTAVEHTKGMVLGFKGAPILAMFDCCCGGIIPAHIADFDFAKVPYLARMYACNSCKQSSLYSWQVSYECAKFEVLLQQYYQEIMRLSDIHITKKDKAGLVTEVKLKGSKCAITVSGKKLYSLLKEVKSFYFDVHKKSGKIVFNGRGFGHHIGLCQWGARQMVRDGWDYKSILRFYYPGTYFMHLI